MPIIYLFINFVFFKGMSPLLLDESMTALGALIVAVVVTGCIVAGELAINIAGAQWTDRWVLDKDAAAPWHFFLIPVAATTLAVLLSYFVLIGFSADLADWVDLFDDFGDFSRRGDQEWLWFIVMISIPILVSLVPRLWQVRATVRRMSKVRRETFGGR